MPMSRMFVLPAVFLIALSGCKDTPTEPDPEPVQKGIRLLSLTDRVDVSLDDTLHFCWELVGQIDADSLIVDYLVVDSASRSWKFLRSVPCSTGCLDIPVREIDKAAFILRIRTPGTEKSAQTARIEVFELKALWFTTYMEASVIRAGDTLHVCWSTLDLDRSEVFIMEYSSFWDANWKFLRNVVIGEYCTDIPAAEIPVGDFYLRLRNAGGAISATSAQIHVTVGDERGTIVFLPTVSDTLIYHRDVLRWNTLPDHGGEVRGVYVQQQIVGRNWESPKWFDVSTREFRPSDLIGIYDAEHLDLNPRRRFRIRAQDDTAWTYSSVFIVIDFRLSGPPPGSTIKRGTIVYGGASHPTGPTAEHFWSTDGGTTWMNVGMNAFSTKGYETCTRLFPLSPGQQCYYAIKGWRGARLFADTLGPYIVVDDTRPLVTFKTGDKLTYEFMTDSQRNVHRDTVTGTLERIEQTGDRIEYTFRTVTRTGAVNSETVVEYPSEMHRLSGWIFDEFTGHLTLYRFADTGLDEYSLYWDDGASRASMTMRLGIGLDTYSLRSTMGGTWYARSTTYLP